MTPVIVEQSSGSSRICCLGAIRVDTLMGPKYWHLSDILFLCRYWHVRIRIVLYRAVGAGFAALLRIEIMNERAKLSDFTCAQNWTKHT